MNRASGMHICAQGLAAVATGALLFATACGGGDSAPQGEQARRGLEVYRSACLTCHQADGAGIAGVYPPLRQTAWVEGDEGRLIRLLLHGMEGPMVVDGQRYDQRMTKQSHLTDEEIAAVLTFVRQRFGNEAGPVTADEVRRVRQASERQRPWSPDVLWETTGIPGADSSATVAE